MFPLASKKTYLLIFSVLLLIFSLLFSLQINPTPLNSVYAQSSGYCENGWKFNGGDAGDDSNWEYTGCTGSDYDEEDGGRDKWWEDEEDDDNTNYCDDESWTNEETDGSYWCDNGRICFEQWRRDESCNISRDGEDCKNDSRCQGQDEDQDNSCQKTYQYPECQSDGQVYEVFKDCNDNWITEPTGQSCDAGGGGGEGDEEENQGGCPSNQYWDTESGQCAVNDLTQTQENDAIYCRDQCGGSCAGDLGAKYCTNPDGGRVYDCTNPDDQWVAECQNQLGEEFQHVGIDPGAGAGDLAAVGAQCGYADLDGGECRGAEFCKTHILYCDGEVAGNPEVGGNCKLVPGLCGVGADENGNLVIERPACNPECGSNERCMDDGNGAGFCQALENIPANPSNPCEADPNSEFCQAERQEQSSRASFESSCDSRLGSYYTECNWETRSVRAVCGVGNDYETRDLGQQSGICKAPEAVGNTAYCAGKNCGEGFHCEVSSGNTAECKPNYGEDGEPLQTTSNIVHPLEEASIPRECQGITNPDRLDECLLRLSSQSAPGTLVADICRGIINPDRMDDCLSKTGKTVSQGPSDATCQAQNATSHYCDGNVCIEKSSGWDGNACVDVYKTVGANNCSNSCAGDNQQSGQAVKLLSCVDETDSAKREECNKENVRITQTGQKVDQASLVRASLSVDDCSSLADDAKAVCEEKNTQTRQLARALENISLEACSSGTDAEKAECKKRNEQTIKQSQTRLQLGVEDCSGLTGDKKTNCEFTNYQRDQIAQAAASYVAEDCSKYQNEAEVLACTKNNQTRYQAAVSGTSAFVGLAELGASCVYTEACEGGTKKACAGKVAAEGNAPVCKYDPAAASCSACTTGSLNLTNKENKCSEDGQTCLNGPGLGCISDAQCQTRLQAAQQAAAAAPIDPTKYFSQQFEEGVSCKQVQACDDGQEQVCEGKGSNGTCDLSQGGGICSPCQAKGTVTLNRVATCNPETNKCEGAPALSGCMNDDQCKPVVTNVTSRAPVGAGQIVGSNGNIFDTRTVCQDEIVEYNNFVGSLDSQYANDIDGALFDQGVKREKVQKCYQQYVDTGKAATVTTQVITQNTEYYYAQREAANATTRLDQYEASIARGADYGPADSIDSVLLYQAEQQIALDRLKQAEAALGIIPQASLALDRSTVESQVDAYTKINQIRTTEIEIGRDLAETAEARNRFNQVSEGNTFNTDAIDAAYAEFEAKRNQAQGQIDQLAALRNESGKGVSQMYQTQLDTLPTKADQQFETELTIRESNQLANLAKGSTTVEVVQSAEAGIQRRAEEAALEGNVPLARSLAQQGAQAAVTGFANIAARETLSPQPDQQVIDSANQELDRVIRSYSNTPEIAQALATERAVIADFTQAQKAANAIRAQAQSEALGTTPPQEYETITTPEGQTEVRPVAIDLQAEQAKLDAAKAEVCAVSETRCRALEAGIGQGDAAAYSEKVKQDAVQKTKLLAEHSELQQQIFALERSGGTQNSDELTRIVGLANEKASELDAIDPNVGALARNMFTDAADKGRTQNQEDYAANTYANNKGLLLAFENVKNTELGTLPNGLDTNAEIKAAETRMMNAIAQMETVDAPKAAQMQADFNLTTFKIDSLPAGADLGSTNGCIVESCNGNGSSAQNICSGQISQPKSFNPFCAAQNGVVDPGEAWALSAQANREAALAAQAASVAQTDTQAAGIMDAITQNPLAATVAALNPLALPILASNYLGYNLVTSADSRDQALQGVQTAWGIVGNIGTFISDWNARSAESVIPVFVGDVKLQNTCRQIYQNPNNAVRELDSKSAGCQVDTRSFDQQLADSRQVVSSGGTVKDLYYAIEGQKALSQIRQDTIKRAADEAGISDADFERPMQYWTDTQKAKFQAKLAGLDAGAGTDIVSAVFYPLTADAEARAAAARCETDFGRDLCRLDPFSAASYQGVATGDPAKYQQTIDNARKLIPGLTDVPQSDFAWVVSSIGDNQSGNLLGDITAPSAQTIRRDQYNSDEEYYDAIALNISSSSKLNRDQLIDKLLLDANINGLTPDGQPRSREEIAKAVDAYLGVGYYGNQVVANSSSYQWQREAENQYNWEAAQVVAGLVTVAGPLEFLDPTNPIVNGVIKGTVKAVSGPTRVVTAVTDNILDNFVRIPAANRAISEGLGVTDSAGQQEIRSFYDGRAAGLTVDQAISAIPSAQRPAFTDATSQIAKTLKINNSGDRVIAATVLDSVFNPQIAGADVIAERGSVIASLVKGADETGNLTRQRFDQLAAANLIQPAEVEVLAARGVFDLDYVPFGGLTDAQTEVLGHQVAQEVLTTEQIILPVNVAADTVDELKTRISTTIPGESEARVRIINGQVDGIRIGHTTEEESRIIARILEPDPIARVNGNELAERWNALNNFDKDEIAAQVAQEVAVNQAARTVVANAPSTSRQAFIQLGNQASAPSTARPLRQAAQNANAVTPLVGDAVIKVIQGQDLTENNTRALEIAGITRENIQQTVDQFSPDQQQAVLTTLQQDISALARPDLPTQLGLPQTEADQVVATLQQLGNPVPTALPPSGTPTTSAWDRISSYLNSWRNTGRTAPTNTATTVQPQNAAQPNTAGTPPAGPSQVEISASGGKIDLKGEDAICSLSNPFSCVLADGVSSGGGGPAARAVVAQFEAGLNAITDTDPNIVKQKMIALLRQADAEARAKGQGGTTTLVGVKIAGTPENPVAVVTGVGDSRVYLVRDTLIDPINSEDSWLLSVSEKQRPIIRYALEESPSDSESDLRYVIEQYLRRNNITGEDLDSLTTRAANEWQRQNVVFESLGAGNIARATDAELADRITLVDLRPGDRLLLTSDGVHDNLTRSQIEYVLRTRSGDILPSGRVATGNQVEDLLSESKLYSESGGSRAKPDDISAILVDTQPAAGRTAQTASVAPTTATNPSVVRNIGTTVAKPFVATYNGVSWVNELLVDSVKGVYFGNARAQARAFQKLDQLEALGIPGLRRKAPSTEPNILQTVSQQRTANVAKLAEVTDKIDTELQPAYDQAVTAAQVAQLELDNTAIQMQVYKKSGLNPFNWFGRGREELNISKLTQGLYDRAVREAAEAQQVVVGARQALEKAKLEQTTLDVVSRNQALADAKAGKLAADARLRTAKEEKTRAEKALKDKTVELTGENKGKKVTLEEAHTRAAQEYTVALRNLKNKGVNVRDFDIAKQLEWLEQWREYKKALADGNTSAVLPSIQGITSEAEIKSFGDALDLFDLQSKRLLAAEEKLSKAELEVTTATLNKKANDQLVKDTKLNIEEINQVNQKVVTDLIATGFIPDTAYQGRRSWTLQNYEQAEIRLEVDANGILTPVVDGSGGSVIGVFRRGNSTQAPQLVEIVVPNSLIGIQRDAVAAGVKIVGLRDAEFNNRLTAATDLNLKAITPPVVTKTAAEVFEIETRAIDDLIGGQFRVADSTGELKLEVPVSEAQIRTILINRGYDPNDPTLDAVVKRISDQINPPGAAQTTPVGVIPYGDAGINRIEAVVQTIPSKDIQVGNYSTFEGGNRQINPGSGGASRSTFWVSNDNITFTKLFITSTSEQEIKNEVAILQIASIAGVAPKKITILRQNDRIVGYSMENLEATGMQKLKDRIDSLDLDQRIAVAKALAQYQESVGRIHGDLDVNWLEHIYIGPNNRVVFIDPLDIGLTPPSTIRSISEASKLVERLLGDNTTNISPIGNLVELQEARVLGTQILDSLNDGKSLKQSLDEIELNQSRSTSSSSNTTPPAAAPAASSSTRITLNDLPIAPENLTDDQQLYYLELQYERYYQDLHPILFQSIDQAEIARVRAETGMTSGLTEQMYFDTLARAKNERELAAVSLTPEEEREVRAALGSYLPQDVARVSDIPIIPTIQTPVAVNNFVEGVRIMPVQMQGNQQVISLLTTLGADVEPFYLDIETGLKPFSRRIAIDNLANDRDLLRRARLELTSVEDRLIVVIEEGKALKIEVDEARSSGLGISADLRARVEAFNTERRALTDILDFLTREEIPRLTEVYRKPSATVAKIINEELARKGIPTLELEDSVDLYLHLKQVNQSFPAQAATPPLENAARVVSAEVDNAVDAVSSAVDSTADAVRAAGAGTPVQVVTDTAADAIDEVSGAVNGVIQMTDGLSVTGRNANLLRQQLDIHPTVQALEGDDTALLHFVVDDDLSIRPAVAGEAFGPSHFIVAVEKDQVGIPQINRLYIDFNSSSRLATEAVYAVREINPLVSGQGRVMYRTEQQIPGVVRQAVPGVDRSASPIVQAASAVPGIGPTVSVAADAIEVFTQAEQIAYNRIFKRIPQSLDVTINGQLAPITLETITDRNAVFTLTLANGNTVSTTLDALVRNPQQFIDDATRAAAGNGPVLNNPITQNTGSLRNPVSSTTQQDLLQQAESNLLTLKQERGTLANQMFAFESRGWSLSDPFGTNKNQELARLRPLLEAKNQEIRALEQTIKDIKYELRTSASPATAATTSLDMVVSGKNGFRPYEGIGYSASTYSQFEQQILAANPTWVRKAPPAGDAGGSGAEVMEYFDPTTGRGYVSKFVTSNNQDAIASMFVQIDLLRRGEASGLFPRIERLLTNSNGEIRGYVMERFIGQELNPVNVAQFLATVSVQDKKDFLVRLLAYYDESKVAHGDIYSLLNGKLTGMHNIFVVNEGGRNQIRLIDPLAKDNYIGPSGYLDIINNRSNYYAGQIDEARALIDIIFTEQERQDYFVRAMANRLDQERQALINTRTISTSFSDMARQEQSRLQGFTSGINPTCDLAYSTAPSRQNYLAQANSTSNVLGISTGEVLAVATGSCGPIESLVQKVPGLSSLESLNRAAQNTDSFFQQVKDLFEGRLSLFDMAPLSSNQLRTIDLNLSDGKLPDPIKPVDISEANQIRVAESATKSLKEFQNLKVDRSIREILPDANLDRQQIERLKERTTFGSSDVADSLLLGEFPSNNLDPEDKYLVTELAQEIGLKFYFSFLRSFRNDLKYFPQLNDQGTASINVLTESVFVKLASEEDIDPAVVLPEGGKLLSFLNSNGEFNRKFGNAVPIMKSLEIAILDGNSPRILVEINRLKQLHHSNGLLTEFTSNDLVATSYVETLSTAKGVNGNLYQQFASPEVKVLTGKIFHKYPELSFYRNNANTIMNEGDFLDYDKGPWKDMYETTGRIDDAGLSRAALVLMAPPNIASKYHKQFLADYGYGTLPDDSPEFEASKAWMYHYGHIKNRQGISNSDPLVRQIEDELRTSPLSINNTESVNPTCNIGLINQPSMLALNRKTTNTNVLGASTGEVLGDSVYGVGPLCNLVGKNGVVQRVISAADQAYDGALVAGVNTLDTLILGVQHKDSELVSGLLKGILPAPIEEPVIKRVEAGLNAIFGNNTSLVDDVVPASRVNQRDPELELAAEASQAEPIGSTTKFLAGPEEDLPRTPTVLKEITDFPELPPESFDVMQEALVSVIENYNYNSLYHINLLLDQYKAGKAANPNYTLIEAYQDFEVPTGVCTGLQGGNCVSLAQELQSRLASQGISAQIVPLAGGPLTNQAGVDYVGLGHSAVLVPSVESGVERFTLLDPGLLIPVALTFAKDGNSQKITLGSRSFQVIAEPNGRFTHVLEYTNKKKGPVIRVPLITQTWENPSETLQKDILRGLGTYRITRQDANGRNMGLIKVDLVSNTVDMSANDSQFLASNGFTEPKASMSFEQFLELSSSPDLKKRFDATARFLNISDPALLEQQIAEFIQISEEYKSTIWAPTVRDFSPET